MEKLQIRTRKSREVVDITDKVQEFLDIARLDQGLINVFVLHSTAAISIADLDPGTDLDMLDAFEAMMPRLKYRHPHDPDHVVEHILSSLIGVSVTIPFQKGKLMLGTWQRIVLLEFSGPRSRDVVLTPIPLNTVQGAR